MRILALDTSLAAAAACVYDAAAGQILAAETVWQARGHDQTLTPLIARVTAAAGGRAGIDRIAVTVGPGSFTGLRIGISTAKAIGLAFGAPVVGVSTLSAYIAPLAARAPGGGVAAAAIDARHGRVFVAAFVDGRPVLAPRIAAAREAVRAFGAGPVLLAGPAAAALAIEAWRLGMEADVVNDAAAPDIVYVARLGASADPASAPARPLYLSAPETTLGG